MSKSKSESFILELPLQCTETDYYVLEKRFEISRKIYNKCLTEGMKRYNHLCRNKRYRELLSGLADINKQLDKKEKKSAALLSKQRAVVQKELSEIRIAFGFSEYNLHAFVGGMNQHFGKNMDINTAQKLATRAFRSIEKVVYGSGEKVHFKRFSEMDSIEGKDNASGIRYRNESILWMGLRLPCKVRDNDFYAKEALLSRVKYSRIVRKRIRGKYKYYVQLVLEGNPPQKRDRDGNIRQQYGNSRVGIDPSLQSIAYSSEKEVGLKELAPSIQLFEKEISRLQRKMDRSRRATNPDRYNRDGTVIKGVRKKWNKSNNYLKAKAQYQEIHRRTAAKRKQDHQILANHLISLGTDIFVEKTDFRALAKRAKETKISQKTGKHKRKKRFGKSISSKAPGLFFTILNQKLGYAGKSIQYVNTWTFKASQYDHVSEECTKKKLSQRWVTIGDSQIQRDLYSSFLIMNSKSDLQAPDKERCNQTFEQFKVLHDQEIHRIKNTKTVKLFSSFGIKEKRQAS